MDALADVDLQEIDSVCTYCGVGCDIVGAVKDNKIQKIYASKDGVVSEGNLCIKGKYGFEFVDDPNRLRQPRVKKVFLQSNPEIHEKIKNTLIDLDETWFETTVDAATTAAAMKLREIKGKYGRKSFAAIGGARTSCESSYLFQKFTRETMESPNVDNCARVCHSPSLKGMRTTIGEGAATNPYNDIYETEFMVVIGSNTTEAHPIVSNRMINVASKQNNLAVIDVRDIALAKHAKYNAVVPHEANLLILNMMAYVILDEELYNKKFIDERTKGFEEYKQSILNDPYANPDFFRQLPGYEYLAKMIPNIAREYAIKKSMIFWGLGISEHFDGSYAVMAITHLALLTGNIGKVGAGLMPLRGQNNVQGTCDMGVLPYYAPDYQEPKEIGLMTPQIIDAMLDGEIKAILNMGEDILHIHPNVNKTEKAFKNLEFLMVQELFMTEIAKEADIVVGVKSAYEKTGVYINAMRRLHLSQPLVQAEMPDDWEVIQMLDNKLQGSFNYENSNDVWDEVREVAHRRFSGASYHRLEMHRKRGLQWPIHQEDTPVLHLLDFRKDDGLGHFHYHQYHQRGMIDEILNDEFTGFHLTTGRTIAHYNNAAQTKRSEKLNKRYEEDILLVSPEDADHFPTDYVILKNVYGQTTPIKVKFVDSVRPKTLYTTFHHAKSNINRIFGDKRDELIMTAAFKSIKVEIEPFQG
jgi:formate dehydrogenase major subunit